MQKTKKIAAIAAIPVLVVGWALFRPELLFVNKTVNEKLPAMSGEMAKTLSSGMFASYAHETKGEARIVSVSGKRFVELANFSTSNGPDVHLYLVNGSDSSQDAVKKNGYVDLGTLKGNIGDQNYEIPASVDLAKYQAVSVWCARFSVAFGGATLAEKQAAATASSRWLGDRPIAQLAAFGSPIEVTFGSVTGDKRFSGRAAIIEDAGKRFVELNFKKAQSFELRLVKKETLQVGEFPKDAAFISLGKAAAGKSRVAISKEIDAWLYRSIAVIDAKTGKTSGVILLRSAQEKKSAAALA
ncbi:MAG: DM13 domain-containing protein [Armatimonadetes bacterium]|nr:DM13 domain-containing protein [Armatimonadota bacterium]MBS1726505.1 DM13 domain-containing protein [Armatimonadota bacterium]